MGDLPDLADDAANRHALLTPRPAQLHQLSFVTVASTSLGQIALRWLRHRGTGRRAMSANEAIGLSSPQCWWRSSCLHSVRARRWGQMIVGCPDGQMRLESNLALAALQ